MRNLAKELATLVAREETRIDVHPAWFGYCVRKDGWSSLDWSRPDAYHVIYVCQLGELRYRWAGKTFIATPGQAIVIGSDLRPDAQWSQHAEVWEIWVKLTPHAPSPPAFRDIQVMPAPAEAAGLIDHLTAEALTHGGFHGLPLLRPRLHLLLSLLGQEAERARENGPRMLTPHQRIRLVRWTREHLADPPTPEALANEAGLAPDYFARLFHATFGRAPRDWLVLERIQAARRLLDEQGVSIAEAMRLTGFNNAAHFGRLMKRLTGRTPGGREGRRRSGQGA